MMSNPGGGGGVMNWSSNVGYLPNWAEEYIVGAQSDAETVMTHQFNLPLNDNTEI